MSHSNEWNNGNNRLLRKLAYAEEFVEDTERKTATYIDVREDLSTGSTHKLPAEVEFPKKSNKQRVNKQSIYSNDLENWNVKQGVSERSVHLVHEHANAPKFCGANSSKHSSIHVVLVDEQDNILGIEEKLKAHNSDTPLHRGVSVFLFNSQKEIVIQKRSLLKKTWGGFWSNSFCGHPQINETYEQAVYRHAELELGLVSLQKVYFIANYRYKFSINNIVENEICPIYLALSDDVIRINEQEIAEVKLLKWQDFKLYTEQYSANFSPWCKEELKILENNEIFKKFMDSAL